MIIHEHVSCYLCGDNFNPDALTAETGLELDRVQRKGEIIPDAARHRKLAAAASSAWLSLSSDTSASPLSALLDLLLTHREAILRHGANWDMISPIIYTASYLDLCNLGFSQEEHKKLAELNLGINVSCYESYMVD
jgi:hypothetical protein